MLKGRISPALAGDISLALAAGIRPAAYIRPERRFSPAGRISPALAAHIRPAHIGPAAGISLAERLSLAVVNWRSSHRTGRPRLISR